MMYFLTLGAVLLAFAQAHVAYLCPEGYTIVKDNCYELVTDIKNYTEAQAHCESTGGSLASPNSQGEIEALDEFVRQSNSVPVASFWLSYTDNQYEGIFVDGTGKVLTHSTFAPGEPNNCCGGENCLEIYVDSARKMNDLACDTKLSFVCSACPQVNVCSQRLGMEDGSIPDSRITASSTYHERENAPNNCRPSNGRLNNPGSGRDVGGWCPARNDKETPWFVVDLLERLQIEGIIMQGSIDPLGWWTERVTAYQVQYSDDNINWLYVTDGRASETAAQTFPGNTDLTTPVTSMFERPIQARYVRIRSTAYYSWPSMRVELIGCRAEAIRQHQGCPELWREHEGDCYLFVDSPRSYEDGEANCQSFQNDRGQPGHLVSVNSEEENSFLVDLIGSSLPGDDLRRTWLGFDDKLEEGHFEWIDHHAVDYTNWRPDEPNDANNNEDCAEINFQVVGEWNDIPCDLERSSVCKMPMFDAYMYAACLKLAEKLNECIGECSDVLP